MIIRDVSFTICETLNSSVIVGNVSVGTKQSNLVYVGSFWFDDCRISEVTGLALFTREGKVTFTSDSSLRDLYLQFRKQDDAPEMGADSSSNVAPIRGVSS